MVDLFLREWVEGFANRWNADPDMVGPLGKAGFSAVVAFGYTDEENPSILLEIQDGKVVKAGTFSATSNPKPDWDLRATLAQWEIWKKEGLGLSKLGVTVSNGQLQFRAGDYRKMIRTPELAAPFLRCFQLL